jgi:L-alanine-DL-glutamate epimerase-like enolase superfamily enzyme
MRPTDVRVLDATVTFRHVPFAKPLVLSSGPVDGLTEAVVIVEVDTAGRHASGCGSVLLSYPWAYGSAASDGADGAMRAAVSRLAHAVVGATGDPLSIGAGLLDALPALPLPRLAAEVCLGPVDAAVHDAWARAAGRPAWQLYTSAHVPDLAAFLGPDFAGRYPADYLVSRPPVRLPVQWVVGLGDPLDGLAGARWLKVKLAGADPAADAARVAAVHAAAGAGCRLALDPNEGHRAAADVAALLDALPPDLAVDYIEQPVPRSLPVGPAGHGGPPVLLDEGLPDPRRLDEVTGWDGVVVKTCRGQTAALLTYCWARRRGRYIVQQDLTHVGPALEHAAAFASRTIRAVPAFECNSLQYAPAGNVDLATRRPGLVTVVDGTIDVSDCGKEGIR